MKDWTIVSGLLDEWLDLPEEARIGWVERLGSEYADVVPALRNLMESQEQGPASDFLSTMPKLSSTDSALSAGELVGSYRLLRELGSGGMGVVWLAERADGLFRREVALKLPHWYRWSTALLERFARERQILSQLAHPHIARLYDAGVSDTGQPFLALEYVDGAPLTEYCDQAGLTVKQRLRLFTDVLRAVQYAHANLVVHRDLKPSNILVTREGKVQLLDFGIARLLTEGEGEASDLTREGGRLLTPEYASPEQISGAAVTTSADIYSLGVLLFQLLCGARPSQGERAAECSPPSVKARQAGKAALARALKGDPDTIVLKALQSKPEARYATADAFAADIQRYLRGEAILARAESDWYRAGKFIRRNKLAAGAAASVALAILLGLAVALREARIARAKTETAEATEKFLMDIFRANSSERGDPVRARQTTAAELLDIGAREIDRELTGAPEAKLAMLKTIADMYTDLGLNDRAVESARKEVQLAKATFGPKAPEVAVALVSLSLKLTESSRANDNDEVLREAGAILDRNRDFSSLARANWYQAMGIRYVASNVSKSADYSGKGVEIYRRDGRSAAYVNTLNFLGQAQNVRRKYPEAAAAFSEAIEAAKGPGVALHGVMPALYTYLGEVRFHMMETAEAERSYRLGLDAARRFRGDEHEDTIQTKLRLGTFLFDTGRTQEGLGLLKESTELAKRTKGPDDPFHTAQTMTAYGARLAEYGRSEAGLPILLEATAVRRRANRTGSRTYARGLEALALAQLDRGHFAESEALLDEAEKAHAKIGDTAANGLLDAARLARVRLLLARDDADGAWSALQAVHEPNAETGLTSGGLDYSVAAARTELARGDAGAALQRAVAVRQRLQSSSERLFLKSYEAQFAVIEGRALRAEHQSAQAAALLARAVELYTGLFDSQRSLALADAQLAWAECLADTGQKKRARELLAGVRKIHAAHREPGPQRTTPARQLEARLR